MIPDRRTSHLARPATTPRGAVLVLGGSEGGHHPEDADALAREGFVALSYAYFGAPGTSPALDRIPLEHLKSGVDALCAAAPGLRIGVVGGSRGGEAALLLASVDDRVRAVASVVGSGVVTPGIDYGLGHLRDIVTAGLVAWTHQGTDLPSLPHVDGERLDAALDTGAAVRLRDTYEGLHEVDLESVAIPVEQSDAAILAVSASDDQMWDSPRLSAVSFERLERLGHRRARRHVVLDAGHAIAGAPRPPGSTRFPGPGVTFESGGDRRRNAAAQREAWRLAVDWFANELAESS
jgi:dienelactone hydrolase